MIPSSGLILIDKPADLSSAAVVSRVKRKLEGRKTGHSGTLDPFATGLLPICFGRATKLIERIRTGRKGYRAELTLGFATDTQDLTGKIIAQTDVPLQIDRTELDRICLSFVGNMLQTPPMYSAKKFEGKRLYKLARQNKMVERKPVEIAIYSFSVIHVEMPKITFEVECGEGTYVRTLGFDLAAKLGFPGMLSGLRRTRVGSFSIEESVKLEEFCRDEVDSNQWIRCSDEITSDLARVTLQKGSDYKFRNGIYLGVSDFVELPDQLTEDQEVNVYCQDGKYLGLGLSMAALENSEKWTLKTHKLIDI